MIVETDRTKHQVIIRGERFQVSLTWAQAANLGSLLNQASHAAEPPALPGRAYSPSVERDRR